MNNKYNNGLIYKIVCKDMTITDCYIGSTIDFKQRKRTHKSNCNNENVKEYNYKIYTFMRENGGFNNFEIIEIKKYPCSSKRELELEERKQMELYGGSLNKNIPTRNKKEYILVNRDKINEKSKEWYNNNKEKKKEKDKIRYNNIKEQILKKFNCECGGKYTYNSKVRHIKTNKHQSFLINK